MADTPRVTVPVEPEFTHYRRSQIAHLRPYVSGETLSDRVSISAADLEAGSPKPGDMIARNPANHDDQWLVAADYFAANFEPVSAAPAPEGGAVSGRIIAGEFLPDSVQEALATREEAPAEAGEEVNWKAEYEAVCDARISDRQKSQEVINERDKWIFELIQERDALRAQPPAREDALRSVIYAATDAVLPAACDTTGNGTQARAKMQVAIADGIIAALQAEQGAK